jgi:hypothetical protein
MLRTIASPIKAEALKTYELEAFDTLIEQAELTKEVFDRWLGYSESRIFSSANDVKYRYSTYLSYLKSANEDVQNIARSIIYELKTYPDKYDTTGIVMALAQNGGICNVQKEVGLRMVYASMTDSILQHVQSESLDTAILLLLKNLRETLTERCAEKILKAKGNEMNTHYIITVRNRIAGSIGLNQINDVNAYTVDGNDFLLQFMNLYSVKEVVGCVRRALNDKPRKMDYLNVINYFEKIKPDDVEDFAFKQDFVFDEDGNFTDPAIKYMLMKLAIIK